MKGEAYSEGGKLPSVKVDGGILEVLGGGLEVTGKVTGTDWSVVVTATNGGQVWINTGETLKVAHGLQMNSQFGSINVLDVGGVSQTATIDGQFRILQGSIRLNMHAPEGDPEHNYPNLLVTENAELWGGSFAPVINPLTSAECHFIKTNKKLDIASAFTIYPVYSGNFPPYTAGAWPVLRSEEGFTDGINPTNGDPFDWDMYRSEDEKNWLVKWDPI